MVHQDKISILITFVFGFFAGGYLYLTGFATTFELPEATTDNVYKEFVVTGESFGKCKIEKTCSSFQVLENGSYRLIVQDPSGGESVIREGSIPYSLRKELNANLNVENLTSSSAENNVEDCKFGAGGTNYNFRVSLDEVNYTINTCKTKVDLDGVTWKTLAKLWNFFASLK